MTPIERATLRTMSHADDEARAARARARASWPIRRYALGTEPPEDGRAMSVDERLAEVWRLTSELWTFSGRPWPTYTRADMPGRVVRKSAR